jgi:hypothetical protein
VKCFPGNGRISGLKGRFEGVNGGGLVEEEWFLTKCLLVAVRLSRISKETAHMETLRTSDPPLARDKTSNGVDQARIKARPPLPALKK